MAKKNHKDYNRIREQRERQEMNKKTKTYIQYGSPIDWDTESILNNSANGILNILYKEKASDFELKKIAHVNTRVGYVAFLKGTEKFQHTIVINYDKGLSNATAMVIDTKGRTVLQLGAEGLTA